LSVNHDYRSVNGLPVLRRRSDRGNPMWKMSVALALALTACALPAYATHYVELDFQGVAHTSFVRDESAPIPIYDDYSFITKAHFIFNLDQYDPSNGYLGFVPGADISQFTIDGGGARVYVEYEPFEGFSASLPLSGMDLSKPFKRTFSGQEFSSFYSYSRYEIPETLIGNIRYAVVRSFDSEDDIPLTAS
jgi:hypothetical protein